MKTYIIKKRLVGWRTNRDQTTFIRGTLESLCKYYGIPMNGWTGLPNIKSIRGLVNRVNKDYAYQYGCTYTTCDVMVVKESEVPTEANINDVGLV